MAEISVTLKADKGYDAPWIVIKSEDVGEVQKTLEEIHSQDLFTAVGRAASAFETGRRMGSQLGATTVSVEKVPAKEPLTGEAKGKPDPLTSKSEEKEPAPKPATNSRPRPKPAWSK